MATHAEFGWLRTGEEALAAMLEAIRAARHSIRLEMYIFSPSPVGDRFRDALTEACGRGVRAQVLVDAFGSMMLSDSYWDLFRASGGEFRRFNPRRLNRFGIRDHRKILVCDEAVVFVGGFNIAAEYEGDGVKSGWRDLGLKIHGRPARDLARAVEEMAADAEFKHKPFSRLWKSSRQKTVAFPGGHLLLCGPGRNNPFKGALRHDLKRARSVALVCAYFLPPLRIRRALTRLARRGVRVRLILPGKSDVPLSVLAAQSFYRRLLRGGVEIYEYQPQILHAKLFLIDDVVYAGSSNLDARSLSINYELMLRVPGARMAAEGREIFDEILAHSRRVDFAEWRKTRTLWERIKSRLARWLLARVDPYIARQSS